MDVLTEHFTWAEAQCRCGCLMPADIVGDVRTTAQWLEWVREQLGNEPMIILSWYRCPSWNMTNGGAPNSQHLLGKAVDFVMKARTPALVQHDIQTRLWAKLVRGLGKYPGFTHIDRRSSEAEMWSS